MYVWRKQKCLLMRFANKKTKQNHGFWHSELTYVVWDVWSAPLPSSTVCQRWWVIHRVLAAGLSWCRFCVRATGWWVEHNELRGQQPSSQSRTRLTSGSGFVLAAGVSQGPVVWVDAKHWLLRSSPLAINESSFRSGGRISSSGL